MGRGSSARSFVLGWHVGMLAGAPGGRGLGKAVVYRGASVHEQRGTSMLLRHGAGAGRGASGGGSRRITQTQLRVLKKNKKIVGHKNVS